MVGTTRFELATSPTPRVRSTRLSHVPTIGLHVQPRRATAGYPAALSVHDRPQLRPDVHLVSGWARRTPWAANHLRQRRTRSSVRPETPGPRASMAASGTRSTA